MRLSGGANGRGEERANGRGGAIPEESPQFNSRQVRVINLGKKRSIDQRTVDRKQKLGQ